MHSRFFHHHIVLALVLALVPGFVGAAAPDQFSAPPEGAEHLELTLAEAVALALRTNRSVKSAYLERVVQKFDLKVAQDKFVPNVDISISPVYKREMVRSGDSKTESESSGMDSSAIISQKVETGGDIQFVWNRGDRWLSDIIVNNRWPIGNSWQLRFSQPLLKGGGIEVNTASVTIAELGEQANLLSLKETVTGTVNETILAFRDFGQSVRQVEIIQSSVERAKNLLEMNKVLISMGRMPANELIQSESDLANQEFALESALNSLDNSRLALLRVLDLDWRLQITPVERSELEIVHPEFERCLTTALENRSDYLNELLSMEQRKIDLVLAENNKLWALDLFGNYGESSNAADDGAHGSEGSRWDVGVRLQVPLYGDLTREQRLIQSKTSMRRAELALEEVTQNIAIEVKDRIRDVEVRLKQVGMAKRSRELSEKKLEVEKEKLKVGRSTNFQIVSFQNDLVDVQNAELDAMLAYLNALTNLDTALGTTLLTWNIDYNKENDKWPGK